MKIETKAVTALFNSPQKENKLKIISEVIEESFQDLRYFFCELNELSHCLVECRQQISFPLSDSDNLVSYVFLTQEWYFVKNIVASSALPNELIPPEDLKGQCLLIPIKTFGVLGFYSSTISLDSEKLKYHLSHCIELLICAHEIHQSIAKLEKISQQNYQEFIHLQKRDNNLLKQSHIEKTWIDFSGRSTSFKRDIFFYSQSTNPLNIVGGEAVGKKFLAKLIAQLRGHYVAEFNVIDLAKIDDIIQLNSLFTIHDRQFPLFDLSKENSTLILHNLHHLSPALFNALYERLKEILSTKIKLITTSNKRPKTYDEQACQFFFTETLYVSNRLSNKKNIDAFVRHFIDEYSQSNLKNIKGICPEAMRLLTKGDMFNCLNELKSIIFLAGDITSYGEMITRNTIEKIVQKQVITQSSNLAEQVALYEKRIILKSLVHNNWSKAAAAKQLGLPLRTLNYKCHKFNIDK